VGVWVSMHACVRACVPCEGHRAVGCGKNMGGSDVKAIFAQDRVSETMLEFPWEIHKIGKGNCASVRVEEDVG
jgi:hypothetical protein